MDRLVHKAALRGAAALFTPYKQQTCRLLLLPSTSHRQHRCVGCCWEGNTRTWDTHEVPPLQPPSHHLCSEDYLDLRDLIQVCRIHCVCSNRSHISQPTFSLSSSCAHGWHEITIRIFCTERHWFVKHFYWYLSKYYCELAESTLDI